MEYFFIQIITSYFIIFKLIFGSKSQNDEKILKPIAEKTLSFEESIKKIKQ